MKIKKEHFFIYKSKLVFLITFLLSVLLGFIFSACATEEPEPQFDSSWYGTYTSYNADNTASSIRIDKTGFYFDDAKIECTVTGNKIKITQSGAIIERSADGRALNWMMTTDYWQQRLTGRNGRISGFSYTQTASGGVDYYWRLETDGSVTIFRQKQGFPERYDGVYILKDGVLLQKFTSLNTSIVSLFLTNYIDENYNVYWAYIKDFDTYLDLLENGSNASKPSSNDEGQDGDPQIENPDGKQNLPEEVFYDVVYSAGEGGSIQGSTNQHIKQGENGTTVTAVANEGYEFVGWSDGKTTATRQDTKVMATTNCQARFRLISYTLQYTAEDGGLISGSTTQSVEYGKNATAVTAVPYTGYEFVAWSDGKTTTTRQELSNKESLTVKALFRHELSAMQGAGTEMAPYLIADETDLRSIELAPTCFFRITNDISLTPAIEGQSNFFPLCSEDDPFTGTLNGNDYKIIGLTIAGTPNDHFAGLFSCLGSNALILNLCLESVSIKGGNYVGAFAGRAADNVQIINCSTSGDIIRIKMNDFGGSIGGLIGRVGDNISLIKCINCCDICVENDADSAGGIAGVTGYKMLLKECANHGQIDATQTLYVGGLIGRSSLYPTIEDCHNSGNIKGNECVGGIIGSSRGLISRCYNLGSIEGVRYAGGLCGFVTSRSSFLNCYNTGSISSATAGGLLGYGEASCIRCYNVNSVVGTQCGAIIGNGELKDSSCLYWLDDVVSPDYAVGVSNLNTPSDVGSIKIDNIYDFYDLAEVLNEGLEAPVWEHIGKNSLPTLINNKENENG